MHPALELEDLRYLIARSDSLRRPDLCRLALVSRDWQDVAEPVLWEDLPNIVYLLKLMPRDCWIATKNWNHTTVYGFRIIKPLDPSFWQPLLRKSGYIKRLSVHTLHFDSLTPLASCPPPSGFLRSLHSLRIAPAVYDFRFDTTCDFLIPILPLAALQSLYLERSALSPDAMLSCLSSCASLKTLRVQMNLRAPSATNENILQALQSRALHLSRGLTLQCVFRDPETYLRMFSHLSRIPNITTLHISFARPFLVDDAYRASYTTPTFPSLQNLRLFGCSVDFVIDVLRASPAHPLRLIRVSLDPFEPTTDIAPLVQTIVELCDRKVLRVLVIKSVRLPGEVVKEMDKLWPLRVFKKLTTLYFNRARLSSADLEADVIHGSTTTTPTT